MQLLTGLTRGGVLAGALPQQPARDGLSFWAQVRLLRPWRLP